MVFSSLFFLFTFLPLVLILYFCVKSKYRNIILLIASLIFYAWGEPRYIWIMFFSTILDYSAGRGIDYAQRHEKKRLSKVFLLLSIIGNLSFLIFFKYSNFLISNLNALGGFNFELLKISLPIGISFYTFQTMSYSIDLYRKETKVQKNIFNFATYVTLFPQLIAGPIVRYQTVAEEIDGRVESVDLVFDGMRRFIIGLAKKVLLANNIGAVWHTISSGQVEMSVLGAWFGILCFAFQIYFDFSGYSDMAIGMGKIFGFNFLENFNYPYMANSITDFWRRWHISLGTWFKEYVYIPLGGNRGSTLVQMRNIFIVWLLTGIWHGASWNFIYWGLLFAVLLVLEKRFLLKCLNHAPRFVGHLYTIFFVLISWALFGFDSFTQSAVYLKYMFGLGNVAFINTDILYLISTNIILLLILIVASTPYPKRLVSKLKTQSSILRFTLENGYLIFILVLTLSYLVNSSYNPFLYFKF